MDFFYLEYSVLALVVVCSVAKIMAGRPKTDKERDYGSSAGRKRKQAL